MFDKNGQPLYKQEGPKFTKAMKSQYSHINIPVVYDQQVRTFGATRDGKHAASKEDVTRGYSPVGADQSPAHIEIKEQKVSMEKYLKQPLDAYVSKKDNRVKVQLTKQRLAKDDKSQSEVNDGRLADIIGTVDRSLTEAKPKEPAAGPQYQLFKYNPLGKGHYFKLKPAKIAANIAAYSHSRSR